VRVNLNNPNNIQVIAVKDSWYINFEDGNSIINLHLNANHIEYLLEAIADQKRIEEIIKSYKN
jgi:hypothetical protein